MPERYVAGCQNGRSSRGPGERGRHHLCTDLAMSSFMRSDGGGFGFSLTMKYGQDTQGRAPLTRGSIR